MVSRTSSRCRAGLRWVQKEKSTLLINQGDVQVPETVAEAGTADILPVAYEVFEPGASPARAIAAFSPFGVTLVWTGSRRS